MIRLNNEIYNRYNFVQIKTQILLIFLISVICIPLNAQSLDYKEFSNITFSPEASVVNCFIQDPQGMLWQGTDKGLFSYNGHSTQEHTSSASASQNQSTTKINCGILLDSTHLYLGCDNGILIYNIENDQYEKNPVIFPSDIRALALSGQNLWIGSINGLYKFNIKNNKLENISSQKNQGIPNSTIYSIINTKQNTLFVGTYNGLCYLNKSTQKFETINLPVRSSKNSLLVNSLLEDTDRNCIWVGTEGYLFKYSPESKSVKLVDTFNGNSIKSLAIDALKNLLIGTDNGLYVFNPEENTNEHVVHDSRYGKSLINNIIWNIYKDRDNNIWFGTDYGVSLLKLNKTYSYIPISQLTGTGNGNQIQSIFKDSKNNFWFGGTNGLILSTADKESVIWYKMGDEKHPISHNRIRCIYEDEDKNLWVATDGSINRYDYKTQQFIHYNIVDSTRTRNANWAYQLFEDKQGKLWIATCLGGIFVVDKDKLIKNTSASYVAERNYFKGNGLSDNYILQVLSDLSGNIWALTYNNKINKIDARTGIATKFPLHTDAKTLSNGSGYSLICDKSGYIWVGYFGGLNRIDPTTNKIKKIEFDGFSNNHIKLLAEENNNIWICTSNGTYVTDKKTLKTSQVKIVNNDFTSIFYDASKKEIYLGGVDGYIVFSAKILNLAQNFPTINLTGFFVNDNQYKAGIDYSGKSIRYEEKIQLKYYQNNLSFEFSDFSFSIDEDQKHLYKLIGIDKEWRTVKQNSNRISYTNLSPGKYKLIIAILDSQEKVQPGFETLEIIINPPWYYSLWAKLIYGILIISFIGWIIKYFRDKHLIKIERIEKEKSLELSKLKIDFFTNVSHEFKTPLSLIIAPVSKMLIETKNQNIKKQLGLIQHNALRLNTLIQQLISFERFDNAVNSDLILSHIEFVEFAKGIFTVYNEAFKEKNIQADFNCEIEKIYVLIDVLKVESILNNLISNAYKYTNEGGKISLEISYSEENSQKLIIRLSDTGIGIPEADIAFIYDRFYQSGNSKQNKESSGIGLYLVKKYIELQGGTINISSQLKEGTTFTIELDVIDNEFQQIQFTESATSEPDDKEKPHILIIEDNLEVSEFIVKLLSDKYQCVTAYNGKTGLEQANTNTPDLIVVDVMMPVMNGIEFVSQLKNNKTLAHLPIIMLTAKNDKLTEEKSVQLGVDAFMAKPFDINILKLRIKQLLESRQKYEEKLRIESITLPKEIKAESIDEKFLANLTRIIEDKVNDPDLNVNLLSELSGISTKQIYRKLKQLTGLSAVDYIRTIRIKKAAVLLAQQKFSVAEVMYLVGFSNSSYFSKCFKNQYNTTPKQFIESNTPTD